MYEYTLPMSSRPTQYGHSNCLQSAGCTSTHYRCLVGLHSKDIRTVCRVQVAEPTILVAMLPYDIPTLYFDNFIRNKENSEVELRNFRDTGTA